MAAEATTVAASTLVSEAAAMLAEAQTAANGRPDGDDGFAVIAMLSKIRSPIKLKPKTLVFRGLMWYYSPVWAIARWSNICHMTCGG